MFLKKLRENALLFLVVRFMLKMTPVKFEKIRCKFEDSTKPPKVHRRLTFGGMS